MFVATLCRQTVSLVFCLGIMQEEKPEKELDLSNAGRGVWLVKVPKYLAKVWEKAAGNVEVGRLRITKTPGQKANVDLTLSEGLLALKGSDVPEIPKNHRLAVSTVTRLALGVFSHTAANPDAVVPEGEKMCMEGRIVQKLDCLPIADTSYMKLKQESIKKACLPQRQVLQLDRIVHNYKPVSDHKHNIEHNIKKKAEGKKSRDEKEAVLNMLFAAFEKHQYYNIKDLQKITRQPIVYLKEILKDVCSYNLKNPHKNMWELKPEYRHYRQDNSEEGKDDKSQNSDSD